MHIIMSSLSAYVHGLYVRLSCCVYGLYVFASSYTYHCVSMLLLTCTVCTSIRLSVCTVWVLAYQIMRTVCTSVRLSVCTVWVLACQLTVCMFAFLCTCIALYLRLSPNVYITHITAALPLYSRLYYATAICNSKQKRNTITFK